MQTNLIPIAEQPQSFCRYIFHTDPSFLYIRTPWLLATQYTWISLLSPYPSGGPHYNPKLHWQFLWDKKHVMLILFYWTKKHEYFRIYRICLPFEQYWIESWTWVVYCLAIMTIDFFSEFNQSWKDNNKFFLTIFYWKYSSEKKNTTIYIMLIFIYSFFFKKN